LFEFFLQTRMGLASHSGWKTSLVKPTAEYFGEFLLDGVPSFVGETAEVLSLGGSFRIDVEGMLDQLPGHPCHVRWLPREDVAVSPEEVDERVFLFGVETRPDGGGLAAVACPEVDCID
jgi:hypothetical protein